MKHEHKPGPAQEASYFNGVGAHVLDLNKTNLDISCADANTVIEDPSIQLKRGGVYFRNLREHLIDYINDAEYVLGCCAWVTDKAILQALSSKRGVSLLVQKEDFLRPDGISSLADIRFMYAMLRGMDRRYVGSSLSYCGDQGMAAIRSVGVRGDKHGLHPRMHHKFVLLCHEYEHDVDSDPDDTGIVPYAVWTGSFNFTDNGTRSLENAVVLTNPAVVNAFHREYLQILALSEPLDWRSPYVCPEWRVGS